ncbi:WYL domain-containing protein [Candidatus Methylospira mobilis]|uniref:helix-turn-helix transcriptional regulator n=1 Tax=Candidatus Methylospira mobilis TaxID=1808979 RepID=UPI0028EF8653|nr:WYL domain-containing protein [Candidatus Methylospira mobilis]WNV04017.1 WYL domain-containing protein [Candidatus Methylospira mobilis]
MKKNDTLLRHWRMLREIPRYPRRISTAEIKERLLAAGFDTTLRTIQRDLLKLSGSLPLLGDDSKPQGWSWQADATQLDLPTLEPQAALVFHLAERYLQPLLPASTLDYLSPWFRTAVGVLDNQGTELSAWRTKIRVLPSGQPMLPPVIDREVQSAVTQALLLNKRIAVTYRPRDAVEDKNYEVNPLGIVVRDQVIYLVCTLREYNDIKQLVLNRMRSAQLLNIPARKLKGFDLEQYISQGEFGFPLETGRIITLVADFDRAAANGFIERPLAANQVTENIDEKTVRLTATVPDTNELRRWLLGFGAHAVVLAPATLKADIMNTISDMHQRYLGDDEVSLGDGR